MIPRRSTYLALIGVTLIVATTTVLAQAPIEVVKVAARSIDRQTKLPGEFRPYLAVPIFAKVNSFVKALKRSQRPRRWNSSAPKPKPSSRAREAPTTD